jgi:uncharacterized damage-inducible protein DinB
MARLSRRPRSSGRSYIVAVRDRKSPQQESGGVPEAWLRGPIPGVAPELMPAAHALVQAGAEIEAAAGLTTVQLWERPGGAASVGFHLRHLTASTDRLLTYARGEPLVPAQLRALADEGRPGEPPAGAAELLAAARAALDAAVAALRAADPDRLDDPRTVGRAALPTTVRGLLGHVAEHATRHAGQVVTTARIVRGLGA